MTNMKKRTPCCSPGRGVVPIKQAAAAKPVARIADMPGQRKQATTALITHRPGMIALPGGSFLMGSEDAEGFPADGEGPVREVRVPGFFIDAYAVSNADFAEFAESTGY